MYDIENIVAHQKDTIMALINSGQLDKARVILDFIGPFWLAVDYGEYNPDETECILALANRGEGVVLDIGANIGSFCLHAAKRCRQVFAVEPLFYRTLEINRDLNGLTNLAIMMGRAWDENGGVS